LIEVHDAVAVGVRITHVASAVAVCIKLTGVMDQGAQVEGVADAVTIGVGLFETVVDAGIVWTQVTCVAQTIPVSIHAEGVEDQRASIESEASEDLGPRVACVGVCVGVEVTGIAPSVADTL